LSRNKNRSLIIGIGAIALIVLAALGAYYVATPSFGQPKPTTTGSLSSAELRVVVINQKGSDTMLVLAQRWAEEYMKAHPNVQIAISGGGSGTGIAALINGQIDIADASREMSQKELDDGRAKGITSVEWKVALDGISAIVHPSNPVRELTIEQLGLIYKGDLTNWKQLGGPDLPIITYGRQSNSGTYVYWKEHVLGNKDYRADMQSLNGNADIVDAVSKDKAAIGYVGIAYAESRRSEAKILAVKKDASSPAVMPSQSTILDGSYPISRYLYLYTDGPPSGEVKQYVKWIIGPQGQAVVSEVEYIPLPGFVAEEQLQILG